jgi:hypothetical protein
MSVHFNLPVHLKSFDVAAHTVAPKMALYTPTFSFHISGVYPVYCVLSSSKISHFFEDLCYVQ